MKEITQIFYEIFKHNNHLSIRSQFKTAWQGIQFKVVIYLLLIENLLLILAASGFVKNFSDVSAFTLLLAFLDFLFICVLYNFFERSFQEIVDEKLQKEFLPKLTDEQVLLLSKEKADKVLMKSEGWDNLNYLQEVGREELCKSLTYDNVIKTIKKYNLNDQIKEEVKDERN